MKLGGPEHLGWDAKMYLMAEEIDRLGVIATNIRTYGSKGKVVYPEPLYRPKDQSASNHEEIVAPKSLDDFDIHSLVAAMGMG